MAAATIRSELAKKLSVEEIGILILMIMNSTADKSRPSFLKFSMTQKEQQALFGVGRETVFKYQTSMVEKGILDRNQTREDQTEQFNKNVIWIDKKYVRKS